jgi:hypothetical protein
MKLTYQTIADDSKSLRSLSGLDKASFESLHEAFSRVVRHDLEHFTLEGKPRLRRFTFKQDSVFCSTEDMLLFIVSYLKNNPLQEYHAAMFSMTQPQCNVRIGWCSRWLRQTLEQLRELPARDQRQFAALPKQLEYWLDGTERPIQRSSDAETQREHFSGKKRPIR